MFLPHGINMTLFTSIEYLQRLLLLLFTLDRDLLPHLILPQRQKRAFGFQNLEKLMTK